MNRAQRRAKGRIPHGSVKLADIEVAKVIQDAIEKDGIKPAVPTKDEAPAPFDCLCCGDRHSPRPEDWIFYELCTSCFNKFDEQKMQGRRRAAEQGRLYEEPLDYFESSKDWILSRRN